MISRIIRASLSNRGIVLALALAAAVVGIDELRQMPVDVLPDVSAPRVSIVTEATGLASTEVEQLITYPVEVAVQGVAGARRVRSASGPGISIVWVEFDWDTEDAIARQRVTERLQSMEGTLPEGALPLMTPSSSIMGEIAFVALQPIGPDGPWATPTSPFGAETVDGMELRRVAERDVRRRLLAVDGIANVIVVGGFERQYQILLDPQRLQALQLTPIEVSDAVQAGSENASGGYLVDRGQERIVRVYGRADSLEDLERIHVADRGGVPVFVSDVAEVRIGPAVRRGVGSVRGEPAVILTIVRSPAGDTLHTTARLDEALDSLEPGLRAQGIALNRGLFRQTEFIERAVDNLVEVLRDGAILVAIVLIFFLWHPGATFISVLAIPLSLLGATLMLQFFGFGIDAMTLGGLAIAVGELVDDAIVDIENVARRLRDRAKLPADERSSILATVYSASTEIRSSIVSATIILGLVFIPLLFLPGFEGRLLAPLAVAYLFAIASSLIVAITVTPVLASMLLPRGKSGKSEPPVMAWLERAFAPLLDLTLRHPFVVSGVSACLVLCSVVALSFAGTSFLPELREGSLNIAVVLPPGTSLEESAALGRLAEEALLSDPAVISTQRRTGRAEKDEHTQGPESSELEVLLDETDERSREQLLADLRQKLEIVPGAAVIIGQPISHRIEHMLSGQRSALAIKISGDDLVQLRAHAGRVREALLEIDGLVDVEVEPMVETPQLALHVDPQAAARYALSRGEAARTIGLALWGEETGQIYEDGSSTAVVVRFDDSVRTEPEVLGSTLIPTPSGASVPLASLADIQEDRAPNYIMRENARRRILVSANVAEGDIGGVAENIRRVLAEVPPPPGAHVELTGQFERRKDAEQRLWLLGLLSLLGIALVVIATLSSVRRAMIVLVNLPLALAGGVVGVFIAGGTLSIATTIGFITLFGIATRNGILLATRCQDLEAEGHARPYAARRAAIERLAPILMTALTATLGLLPLGLALGEPGTEIQAPMAMVIVTGLATSTVLNMLVVPTLLAKFGGPAPQRSTTYTEPDATAE